MENSSEVGSRPAADIQTSMWEGIRRFNGEPPMPNPFALSPEEELRRHQRHRQTGEAGEEKLIWKEEHQHYGYSSSF